MSQKKPSQEEQGKELQQKLTLEQLSAIKVMVIDDSNTIRRSAEIFLKNSGCSDIMMPRLDGYQTCSLIKRNARYKSTPVIMLSSKDGLFDRARGRMVGSDQYLTKPFTQETLIDAVQTYAAISRANPQEAE